MVGSTVPEGDPRELGSMVGLFWINSEEAYLGMPPVKPMPRVVLSAAGLRVAGADLPPWQWSEITDLRVNDVPVRSAAARWVTRAASVAAAALDAWVPAGPDEMTVVVATADNRTETRVFSGASVGYTQREVDLSHELLARFVRGATSPTVMSEWWERDRPSETLGSRSREALLESWL
ncbi:hypothetical protein [Streptomyces liangshanensis]|uniref:hypothetical protein n=1 Tax=Streptomyces liangshanensis TaxID=2717324 RepID=UPI0036DCA83B